MQFATSLSPPWRAELFVPFASKMKRLYAPCFFFNRSKKRYILGCTADFFVGDAWVIKIGRKLSPTKELNPAGTSDHSTMAFLCSFIISFGVSGTYGSLEGVFPVYGFFFLPFERCFWCCLGFL